MGTERSWHRRITVGFTAGLLLTGLMGASGAGAHPGHDHGKGSGAPGGIGVNVFDPEDDGDPTFYPGVQWGDTAELEGQEGELVFAGTGCSPANYLPIADEIDGNIALVVGDDNPDDPIDQCPAATFAQKVNFAYAAGAVGFVQVPAEGEEPTANATAVHAEIPAVEVHRDRFLEVLDAVIDGASVEAELVDTYERVELPTDEIVSDVACEDGAAVIEEHDIEFECDRIELLSFVPQELFNGAGVSDLWGWTDVENDDEYVIIGKTNGVAFFRVTDPTAPEYLGELPNDALLEEIWHDIKVYDDHAFIVSESAPHHGMKVFDLTRLREAEVDPERVWDEDALYPLAFSAHNIEINTDTGYAYIVGGNVGIVVPGHCLSGLHMVDINDPTNPTFAGCYFEEGGPGTAARSVGEPVESISPAAYVHDTQCVIYHGPHDEYVGQELCFNSAEDKIVIADVTDKLLPETLGWTSYPDVAYTHQGWLTEDHRYLIVNDELDELEREDVENTRTVVIDVSDLENPEFLAAHEHDTTAITHNNYIVDGLVYQSNYTAGLRVMDTAPLYDDENTDVLEEIAYFDTFPTHGDPTFEGTWSNYPFFDSETIAVSGIDEGLFLLRLADDEDEDEGEAEAAVELTCADCGLEIRAGERDTAELLVTNTGEVDDTFELIVDVPEGWTASADPAEVTLDAEASADVEVAIEVPNRARAGSHSLTVTAASTTDPDVSDTAEIEVEVRRGPPSQPGPPGGDAPGNGNGNGGGQGATETGAHSPARADGSGGLPVGILAVLTALGTASLGASLLRRRLDPSGAS